MLCDLHVHLPDDGPWPAIKPSEVDVCIISRSSRDNGRCLQWAEGAKTACGVFIGQSLQERKEALRWIEQRRALAYDHVEILGHFSKPDLSNVLEVSLEAQLPVILHLSRHDRRFLSRREAWRCLEHVTERFTSSRVVVAHLGGENCSEALRFAEQNSNISLEMSCLRETGNRLGVSDPADVLKLVAERIPPQQIIFGSDAFWPPFYDYVEELACARRIFDGPSLEKVLVTNGKSLLSNLRQLAPTESRAVS